VLQSHTDPLNNPLIAAPAKLPQFRTLPHGAVHVIPARQFKSLYNKGCYSQYQRIPNPDLPDRHSAQHVIQISKPTQPGGGSIVSQRGVSALSPSRFCRKNAAKSWVSYLSQSRSNNAFKTVTSSTQDAFSDTKDRWDLTYNGRHGAHAKMVAAMPKKAAASYDKPRCGIKITGVSKGQRSATAEPVGRKSDLEAQFRMRETSLASQEAALDERERKLRGGTASAMRG